ncbi:hypothetical protein RAD16_05025 [Bradyrhizobium sp. 18BD]
MKARAVISSVTAIIGGTNVEATANTMTISRHGSHLKLLAELAVIGLAHCGHVMLRERGRRMFVPKSAAANTRAPNDDQPRV